MKLSAAQNAALRAIDAGQKPEAARVTLRVLWSRGLIEHTLKDKGHPMAQGWRLTPYGRRAMESGRLMLSNRRRE